MGIALESLVGITVLVEMRRDIVARERRGFFLEEI
jgi:hypothetical protein